MRRHWGPGLVGVLVIGSAVACGGRSERQGSPGNAAMAGGSAEIVGAWAGLVLLAVKTPIPPRAQLAL